MLDQERTLDLTAMGSAAAALLHQVVDALRVGGSPAHWSRAETTEPRSNLTKLLC